MQQQEYLTDRDLARRYNVNRATIWRWRDVGNLPQPVKLSPGCTRWRREDVDKFEAKRAEPDA